MCVQVYVCLFVPRKILIFDAQSFGNRNYFEI